MQHLANAPSTRATLHFVNVKTGVDIAFDRGDWMTSHIVLDYAADGLYMVIGNEAGASALLLMNPATGDVKTVLETRYVQAGPGNKVFWAGAVNPTDPHPLLGLGPEPDQIDRLNLVDGSRVEWFYRPGSTVGVVGQDLGGHPIVTVSGYDGQPTEFLVLHDPATQQSIVKGLEIPAGLASPIADRHGVRFGRRDGIYLSTPTEWPRASLEPGWLSRQRLCLKLQPQGPTMPRDLMRRTTAVSMAYTGTSIFG